MNRSDKQEHSSADFKKHLDYEILNHRIHHQAPRPLGHPAFVQHLCLWLDTKTSEAGEYKSISNYLNDLLARLKIYDAIILSGTTADNYYIKETDRGRIALISFFWHFIPASITVTLHTEYITITTILDASWVAAPAESIEAQKARFRSDSEFFRIFELRAQILTRNSHSRYANNPSKLNAFSFTIFGDYLHAECC